jgi:hypothetical protein
LSGASARVLRSCWGSGAGDFLVAMPNATGRFSRGYSVNPKQLLVAFASVMDFNRGLRYRMPLKLSGDHHD